MSADYEKTLGRRIASHRRRRGLSQKELARLLDRSEAWVSQVERGVRRIDRMTVLEKVADVLGLPVAELAAGSPVLASNTEGKPSGAHRLRLALSGSHRLSAVLGQPEHPDMPALRTDVERAWTLTHEGRYAELSDLLERLVPHLESAARSGTGEDPAEPLRLLASMYGAYGAALANMGEPDVAWVAVDRAIAAAERTGDPLLMAAGEFRLSIVFLGSGYYEQAARVARSAAEALAPLATEGRPETVALRGALTLQHAVASARLDRGEEAYQLLRHAREMAEQVGEGRNDYSTEFGPLNVGLHEVAIAADLGDAGTALRAAESVDPSALSSERQARFRIDLARAHAQRRQIEEATVALTEARRLAPELVRAKPVVRQLVSDLLVMSPQPSASLRTLADEMDVEGR
ncbi:helix-turn-helix domain-containing protein [Streptomyces barkulensis]|uniref:helix-turn-helix domain-containing protein n=1 Tax=Streptomyces barkulensis TaxID=1257026 RepID=UPI000C6D1D5F|nr:helix-turn-helix transcriptional regulator [Streptomyces barkulensis]